eukprot:3451910-Prymnesium_polylepis.2
MARSEYPAPEDCCASIADTVGARQDTIGARLDPVGASEPSRMASRSALAPRSREPTRHIAIMTLRSGCHTLGGIFQKTTCACLLPDTPEVELSENHLMSSTAAAIVTASPYSVPW